MTRRVGRPQGRVKPHRPVLGARVPEEFYARIKASAAKSGRTLSEELIWYAQQGYEWETKLKQILVDAGLPWAALLWDGDAQRAKAAMAMAKLVAGRAA